MLIPEVIQAIQNGLTRWKSTGCCLIMISPAVQMRPEVEKIFHVLDLPLPTEADIFSMQQDLAKGVSLQDGNGNPVEIEADLSGAKNRAGNPPDACQQTVNKQPGMN